MGKFIRAAWVWGLVILGCSSSSREGACERLTACGVGSADEPAGCASKLSDCSAGCINQSTCNELVDGFSGSPSPGNAFVECKQKCGAL